MLRTLKIITAVTSVKIITIKKRLFIGLIELLELLELLEFIELLELLELLEFIGLLGLLGYWVIGVIWVYWFFGFQILIIRKSTSRPIIKTTMPDKSCKKLSGEAFSMPYLSAMKTNVAILHPFIKIARG